MFSWFSKSSATEEAILLTLTRGSLRAVQYLRMSTDAQSYSLGHQAAAISAFAATNGYQIIRSYEDAGRSGVTTKGRAGLASLLADVVKGPDFDTILVLDVSRWGRYQDPDEAAHYEFLCKSAGVSVKYCAERFGDDFSSPIMKQLKRVMAGEYSRDLSAKVQSGKKRHAEMGHVQGAVCPYGIQRYDVLPDGSPGLLISTES
jgi:DNA invertase Pin-like site-specific DNA recombinase